MGNEKITAVAVSGMDKVTQPAYEKKIGRTSYNVHFHFDEKSKSTMEEKLVKLVKEELDTELDKPL